jgi:hypothetical protein
MGLIRTAANPSRWDNQAAAMNTPSGETDLSMLTSDTCKLIAGFSAAAQGSKRQFAAVCTNDR